MKRTLVVEIAKTNQAGPLKAAKPEGPPFNCEQCAKSFPRRGDLYQHIRNRHPDIDQEGLVIKTHTVNAANAVKVDEKYFVL